MPSLTEMPTALTERRDGGAVWKPYGTRCRLRCRASTPPARPCGCLHELDQHTLADQERGVVRGDDHLDDTLVGSFVAGVRLQLALPERAGNAQDPTACNLCGIGLRDDLRRL